MEKINQQININGKIINLTDEIILDLKRWGYDVIKNPEEIKNPSEKFMNVLKLICFFNNALDEDCFFDKNPK